MRPSAVEDATEAAIIHTRGMPIQPRLLTLIQLAVPVLGGEKVGPQLAPSSSLKVNFVDFHGRKQIYNNLKDLNSTKFDDFRLEYR